jgi:hypothetical protein
LKVDIISPKADISWPVGLKSKTSVNLLTTILQPKLHSILVVATTVDIVLLGISFRDSSGKALPADCKDLRNANIYMMGNTPLFRVKIVEIFGKFNDISL